MNSITHTFIVSWCCLIIANIYIAAHDLPAAIFWGVLSAVARVLGLLRKKKYA